MNSTTTTTSTSLPRTILPGVFVFFLVLGIMLFVWIYSLIKNWRCECCQNSYQEQTVEEELPSTQYERAWFYTVESNPKMEICSICLNNSTKNECVVKLPCGHEFHQNCITTWLEESSSNGCPLCRAKCHL